MNFLNTHWTWQYALMLLFVFISAWMVAIRFGTWWFGYYPRGNRKRHIFAVVWAALATFFFHQWW